MIVVLTHNYPTADNPTAGVFIKDHIKEVERTHGMEAVVYNHPFGEYPMTVSVKNPLKWPKFIAYFVALFFRIRKQVKGAELVIAHWWIPNGVFPPLFHGNVQVICHGTDLYWLRKYPSVARFFKPSARRVRSWQCVSQDLERILLSLYPFIPKDRVTVAPMPVSDEFYEMDIARDPRLVVSVGSLIPRKNFDLLIEAAADLPEISLAIFGDGPERERLQALIDRHDLGSRVALRGSVPRDELRRVFNEASLFALVSDDEGFGMVLKEAQACGCKTMAYSSDGMVDTGIDYPLKRSGSIAAKIKEIFAER
jgi:glycosyltransferase involved in cell wall biosynthesis